MRNNLRTKFRRWLVWTWLKEVWPLRQDFCRRWLVNAYLLNWNFDDIAWVSNWSWTNITVADADIWYNKNVAQFNWVSSYIESTLTSWSFSTNEIEVNCWVKPTVNWDYYIVNKDWVTSNRDWVLWLWNYAWHMWEIQVLVFTTASWFSYSFSNENVITAWVRQNIWFSRDTAWVIRFYINWIETPSNQWTYVDPWNINDSWQPLHLWYRPYWPAPWYYNWQLFNVLIYNKLLTNDERRQNYLHWLALLH